MTSPRTLSPGALFSEDQDNGENGAQRQWRLTRQAIDEAGLTVGQVWLRYFSLTGAAGEYEVDAYLNGLLIRPPLTTRVERMGLEVIPAGTDDRPLLRQLMELYRYDFSELDQSDVDDDGLYGYRWLDAYWTEAGRHPFLFRVDGHPAGFALVRSDAVTEMAEFFVLRKYRHRGIGTRAARALLSRFPGRWTVSQIPGNHAATGFWRAAIPVPFDEQQLDGGQIRQTFTI